MKLQDTTGPIAHRKFRVLFNETNLQKHLKVVECFRIHMIGLYFTEVGPTWASQGRREGDFLHHIDFVRSGRRHIEHRGNVIELSPGWAWFLPGCTPVERRCEEPCQLYFLKFRCEWLPGVDPLLDWPERKPLCLGRWKEDDLLRNWKLQNRDAAKDLFLLQTQVLRWLAKAVPHLDTIIIDHIQSHGRFQPVFDLIEEKLGADLRVEDMAKALRMSVSAFSMAFARNVGLSPKAYFRRRLNQEAIQLLIRSDDPVKLIAFQLRFSDEFYFNRFFKELNGLPPAQYRQRFFGRAITTKATS
jgi:AraC-like DNA-binding protein